MVTDGYVALMKALTWQGVSDVRVDEVPDPTIQHPTDIIVRITSTGLCGSDLHLYTVLAPYLDPGDVLGHEPMGIVEELGPQVTALSVGDRVVIPFNVSCGDCWMCGHDLHSQCETTQVHEYGTGASLFGYTKLALWAGARCSGPVPPRSLRQLSADQGARGSAR